eukprot:Protomagalhaensia_sp_Gyna_25__465@NODE_121_length_5100_cov_18_313179_g95_i0_p4_GENE_NODE_121_length_5100_cov_18_313179_g95_i0NODE_121_length_5100_cov_18_313179_g95_i0_p4_ORF_typecomplete_len132_score14_80_NODE_121_length_5100_cov_18_313179_g95_i011061501
MSPLDSPPPAGPPDTTVVLNTRLFNCTMVSDSSTSLPKKWNGRRKFHMSSPVSSNSSTRESLVSVMRMVDAGWSEETWNSLEMSSFDPHLNWVDCIPPRCITAHLSGFPGSPRLSSNVSILIGVTVPLLKV